MIIVYDSLTGSGKKVAQKIGLLAYDINSDFPKNQPILLLTRSYNFGEVPVATADFLKSYSHLVKGVAVAGNRNWGSNFGAAGDKINAEYGIPLVKKYEGLGFPADIAQIVEWVNKNS